MSNLSNEPGSPSGGSVNSVTLIPPLYNTGTATDVVGEIIDVTPTEVYSATTPSSNITGLTYNNGAAGVGATLTKTSAFTKANLGLGTDPIIVNERYLIKDLTTQIWNGTYVLTSNSGTFVLTRATDSDEPSEIFPQVVTVSNGANLGTNWAQRTQNVVFGTSNIVYSTTTPTTYVQEQGTHYQNAVAVGGTVAKTIKYYATHTYNGLTYIRNAARSGINFFTQSAANIFGTTLNGTGNLVGAFGTWIAGTVTGMINVDHTTGKYIGVSDTNGYTEERQDSQSFNRKYTSNTNGVVVEITEGVDGVTTSSKEAVFDQFQSFYNGELRTNQVRTMRDPTFGSNDYDYPSQFNRVVLDISTDYNIDDLILNVDNGKFITTNNMSAPITINLPGVAVNGYTITIGYTNGSSEKLTIQDPNGYKISCNNIQGRSYVTNQAGFVTMTYTDATHYWNVQDQTGLWLMEDQDTYVSPIASRMIFSAPAQLASVPLTGGFDRFNSINGGLASSSISRIAQETVFEPGVITKAWVYIPENTLSVGGTVALEVNGIKVAAITISPGATGLVYATNSVTTSQFLNIPLTTSDLVVWHSQFPIQTGLLTLPSINTEYILK